MKSKFNVGDLVRIKSRRSTHKILQLIDKGSHISALLTWRDDDTCWWPTSELEPLNQLSLFTEQEKLS